MTTKVLGKRSTVPDKVLARIHIELGETAIDARDGSCFSNAAMVAGRLRSWQIVY